VLVVNVEVELSGHIHDKGFLTLPGYLRERYGGRGHALGATLTFEQSYEQIDGDSAASAELYALLSELAGVPLRQDIAVTGSVNQHGELQAIGASPRRSRASTAPASSGSAPTARA
jgi:predicted ATP-dependent protease